jgi:hypothetical protein
MTTSEHARALGSRGGLARARRLSSEATHRIAAMGGRARRESLRAARQIDEKFAYVATIEALGPSAPSGTRLERFSGPLPGI